MQDAGVDEVARWLVDSVHLPQYEQAFRDNEVDGPMLLDIVANAMLGELIENRLHQCRLRSQVAKFERRASADGAPAAGGEGEGEGADGVDARGAGAFAVRARRRVAEAALPGDERPRQRARYGEPEGASGSERGPSVSMP